MRSKTLLAATGIALLWSASAFADTVVSWNGSGANDNTTWGQLGADSTPIVSGATAISAGGKTVTVGFAGGSGMNSVQCPALACSWTGGFTAGEALIWTNNGIGGTGPLSLSFGTDVQAAGLAFQSDAPSQFTATATVVLADASSFSTSTTSDAQGDLVFLGLQDTSAANIASISFDVTFSGSDHDFAAGTLITQNAGSAVPEPKFGFLLLAAFPLVGFGVQRLRRLARQ